MNDLLPPHSLEAERGALSCMLQDRHCVADAIAFKARPEWFYDLRHQNIFSAIVDTSEAGRPVDVIVVTEALRRRNDLDRVGGIAAMSELADYTPSAANLKPYLELLRDNYGKRRLLALSFEIGVAARNGGTFEEAMGETEAGLLAIGNEVATGADRSIKELLRATVDRMEAAQASRGQLNGLPTGFYDLDRILRGMKAGQMIVLASATSRGKTALAMNIVERVAVHDGIPTAVFSLEMGAEELTLRLTCSMACVSMERAESGELSEADMISMTPAHAKISKAPLHIVDQGGLTFARFAGLARHVAQRHGIKFIVLDYLQLLKGAKKSETRTVEVGEISRGIKALAKELKLPILALAQLNREYDRDGNRPPRLSDLRESGSIEQDADSVIFIHRPNIEDTEAEIIVAKNRNGRVGKLRLLFRPEHTRFANMTKENRR